jgi:putative polyhydroxyalkanoate system protein
VPRPARQDCYAGLSRSFRRQINRRGHAAMSKIHIKRDHNLGLTRAKSEVTSLAESLKADLHADFQWNGNRLSFKRSGASGTIDVGEDFVELDIKLGMALALMKGKIETVINHKLDEAIGSTGQSSTA